MAKRQRPEMDFPADQVWSAAATAYRINGGYFKNPVVEDGKIVKPTNRELVRLYLYDSSFVTDADREYGRRCRQTLAQAATMTMLQNRDTQWTHLTAQMTALEKVTSEYELSVITAAPKSYEQGLVRENVDSRLAYCEAEPLAPVNAMVEIQGEVVRSNFSQKWNTFYTTIITTTNHQVFFAYRERLNIGSDIRIRGRVKRHADRATQLSRVKLVEQEVV